MTSVFISRPELLPSGETIAQHTTLQKEEADAVQKDKDNQDGEDGNKKGDKSSERLLSTIFAKSGVQSVVQHDHIMSTSGGFKRKVAPDPEFIRREAKKTAAAAKPAPNAPLCRSSQPCGFVKHAHWAGTTCMMVSG